MMHQGSLQTLHTSSWYPRVTVAPVESAGKVEQFVPLIIFATSLPPSTTTKIEYPSKLSWMLAMCWMCLYIAEYTGADKDVSCIKNTYSIDVKLFRALVFQRGWSYAITANSLQHVWVGHTYISECQTLDWSPPHCKAEIQDHRCTQTHLIIVQISPYFDTLWLELVVVIMVCGGKLPRIDSVHSILHWLPVQYEFGHKIFMEPIITLLMIKAST